MPLKESRRTRDLRTNEVLMLEALEQTAWDQETSMWISAKLTSAGERCCLPCSQAGRPGTEPVDGGTLQAEHRT